MLLQGTYFQSVQKGSRNFWAWTQLWKRFEGPSFFDHFFDFWTKISACPGGPQSSLEMQLFLAFLLASRLGSPLPGVNGSSDSSLSGFRSTTSATICPDFVTFWFLANANALAVPLAVFSRRKWTIVFSASRGIRIFTKILRIHEVTSILVEVGGRVQKKVVFF